MDIKTVNLQNADHNILLTNIGASIMKWQTKNSKGQFVDIILGFNEAKDYLSDHPSFGAIVGRFANRIENAAFNLNGKVYELEQNVGIHHLHGGSENFGTKFWKLVSSTDTHAEFSLTSPHLEGNYPGKLEVTVQYTLVENGRLSIIYSAISDRDTFCNLTNHSYFNLSGESSGEVFKDHLFQINANHFLPTDSNSIPTGVYQSVENTIMDLTNLQKLDSARFEHEALFKHTRSYDHHYILGRDRKFRHAAHVYSESSGISLDCYTDMPGIQFYLSCFLDGIESKTGSEYKALHAFCLEAQHFPDSPNKNYFPSSLLIANESYSQETIYSISLKN